MFLLAAQMLFIHSFTSLENLFTGLLFVNWLSVLSITLSFYHQQCVNKFLHKVVILNQTKLFVGTMYLSQLAPDHINKKQYLEDKSKRNFAKLASNGGSYTNIHSCWTFMMLLVFAWSLSWRDGGTKGHLANASAVFKLLCQLMTVTYK